jgi:hypothetical protein
MVLDMNINLNGIDEDFLDDLDELIEETRVEYFIINPRTKEELEKTQKICKEYERFKYSLPVEFRETKDDNCVAIKIEQPNEIDLVKNIPVVIESICLDDTFTNILNTKDTQGVVLNAKECDNKLVNFTYSISHDSLKDWTKKGLTNTDYNRLGLQSDYPNHSYDDLFDGLLKDMSDMTFRAEQTIAAGGTRTILKTFGLY